MNKEILTQAKVSSLLGREERTAWPARYYGIAIDHNDAVFRLGRLFARIDVPHAARNLTPLEHHHVGIEHFHDDCRTAAAKHLTIRFPFTSLEGIGLIPQNVADFGILRHDDFFARQDRQDGVARHLGAEVSNGRDVL